MHVAIVVGDKGRKVSQAAELVFYLKSMYDLDAGNEGKKEIDSLFEYFVEQEGLVGDDVQRERTSRNAWTLHSTLGRRRFFFRFSFCTFGE